MRDVGSRGLTKKQQLWLRHLEACEAGGQVLAGYAASHGLGVGQLYSWRSRLRRKGLLGGSVWSRGSETQRGAVPVARALMKRPAELGFTAVRVVRGEPVFDLRIRFGNGIVLECGRWTPDARLLALLAALS